MALERARYSVYETGTDRPICIWVNGKKCAAALGIGLKSFYRQVVRTKRGAPPKRYEIIIHDTNTEGQEDTIE